MDTKEFFFAADKGVNHIVPCSGALGLALLLDVLEGGEDQIGVQNRPALMIEDTAVI